MQVAELHVVPSGDFFVQIFSDGGQSVGPIMMPLASPSVDSRASVMFAAIDRILAEVDGGELVTAVSSESPNDTVALEWTRGIVMTDELKYLEIPHVFGDLTVAQTDIQMITAVVPDGQSLVVLRAIGPTDAIAEREEEILTCIRSLR